MQRPNAIPTAANFILLVWLVIAPHHAAAAPGQPGISDYTLELQPFAEHAGENAMELTYAPDNSGRVFLATQSGQVFAFDPTGQPRGTFLDIAAARDDFTRTDGAFNGLMYVAFHPDYADENAWGFGRFYTGHQVALSDEPADYDSGKLGAAGNSDVRFVVAEWRVDANNPDRIDPTSYRILITLNFHTHQSNPHALGEIAFNPYTSPGDADHGLLYIAVGDSNDRNDSGHTDTAYVQQPDNPFGKVLRIDPAPDRNLAKPYTIPAENPFGTEVFALGLRNPQSFSFAKDLNDNPVIVAFDMGAAHVEEVNLVRKGGNYGWDRYEGTADYNPSRAVSGPTHRPITQYPHQFPTRPGEEPSPGPAAVIGGLVVTDPDRPSFQGQVLFADLPRGTFFHANLHHALTLEGSGQQTLAYVINAKLGEKIGTFADVIGADRADVRFGVDQAGGVYLVSKQTQTIYKTTLIYTGTPVQAKPQIATASIDHWLSAVIGGLAAILAAWLVWSVYRSKRRHKPESIAIVLNAPTKTKQSDLPSSRAA